MPRDWKRILSKDAEESHTEDLIRTVEKYPAVWDNRHPDYCNAKRREIAWENICASIIPEYYECEDKLYKCIDLKKKWGHVRDYFRKRLLVERQSIDSNSTVPFRRRYVYDDLLQFLKPVILPQSDSREEGRSSSDDKNFEPAVYITLRDPSPLPGLSAYPEISLASLSSPSPPTSPSGRLRKRVKREPKDPESSLADNPLNLEPTEAEVTSDYSHDDDDTKFLLSFRKYMQKMNDEQKVEFQIGMLKLVKETLWETF